jgi:hypothetical protein
MLPLLLYGDLSDAQVRDLEEHLAHCEPCRNVLHETRKLHELLSRVPAPAPSEEFLRDARMQFRAAMIAEHSNRSLALRVRDFFSPGFMPRPALVAGGLALLAIGFASGRFSPHGTAASGTGVEDVLASGGTVHVTNMRTVENTESGGQIELTFDAVKSFRIRGSIDEPAIQKVLACALVSGDPGVRMRAASSVTLTKSAAPEREVKAALLLALRSDQNDGVRKEALQAIQRYAVDREVRDALLDVLLNDPNPGLRIAAINALDSLRARGYQPDAGELQAYRELQNSETSLYVRVKARSIIEEKIP